MCGRFSQLPIELQTQIVKTLREMDWPDEVWQELAGLTARYNLAPTQKAGVLHDSSGGLVVDRLRWGLLPFWAKDKKLGYQTINARSETVATKPAFRDAFKHRRALIPMAGYFEWTETAPKVKQPWFVHRHDGVPLWAAGLWEPRHKLQAEDDAGTFTVITTTAVDQAGQVHDRMPVFLSASDAEAWMRETPEEALQRLLSVTVPPIAIYPVSRRVNAPKDDDPGLIEPIDLEAA